QRYSQRLVKATTVRGRIAEGRFTGLDSEGRLVIRREMPGAGEASYLLHPAEIARLELLER
ncbi:MFS transporter, partial [Pseudomonas aeruginosa]|nr:MFS transporter [Pseudomonas aeruginosa]